MIKHIILAFKNYIEFSKSIGLTNYLSISLLHVFLCWNGIQFLLIPTHLDFIVDYQSNLQAINFIIHTHARYIPVLIFSILSVVFIFLFFKNYMEILFLESMRSPNQNDVKSSFSERFNLLINYTIPSFFHNLGVLFLMSSFLLLLLMFYLLLVILNVNIIIDVFSLIRVCLAYFIIGLVLYNTVTIDFILPEIANTGSYSNALSKFAKYFKNNKLNIFYFYMFKLCLITINMIILMSFISLRKSPLFALPFSVNINVTIMNISLIFLGLFISLMINTIFIHFFNLYVIQFQKVLFSDYAEFDEKPSIKTHYNVPAQKELDI